MNKLFKHIIITRFNLVLDPPWPQKTNKERETWLLDRIEKFKPCLESVNNQTNKQFEWLIYLDVSTPTKIKKILSGLVKRNKKIKIIYINKKGAKGKITFCYDLEKDFIKKIKINTKYLITTRLDSDDVIIPEFVKKIQQEFRPEKLMVINFPRGIIWEKSSKKKKRSN